MEIDAILLLSAVAAAATAVAGVPAMDPAWPGGGFPPLPWGPNWRLEDAVTALFLGNTSGSNSAEEIAREAAGLGVVGLGWQLGLFDGSNLAPLGGLESKQAAAAAALKQQRPGVKVLVSGDIDVTFGAWDASMKAMRNDTLAYRLFMHRPNGSMWHDKPWGEYFEEPWYNFTDPVAADWWIHNGPIARAMADPNIDRVYLDGANTDDAFWTDNFASATEIKA